MEPATQTVTLAGGRQLGYDFLVIATGASPRPDQTPGMLGPLWRDSVFDFYTLDGATALATALQNFDGGRLVVHIVEMPIKCPVAPLEFTFLADAYFRRRGIRDQVEIVYTTPLPGAFTKPIASARLGSMLDQRRISVESDFLVERVDSDSKTLISYDEREVPFDLLVTVPLTGSYPLPVLGPFGLLTESARNHWGKLAFRWIYWHLLLPGRPIPLPAHLSMLGNTATHMPQGLGGLPGMTALATRQMKSRSTTSAFRTCQNSWRRSSAPAATCGPAGCQRT